MQNAKLLRSLCYLLWDSSLEDSEREPVVP
jgi:hypothetical protein